MNICIYCGSKNGNSEAIKKDVIEFCELISKAGFNLVYGGSDFGTMGLVAEIFRKNGKEVMGVRPKKYQKNEDGTKNSNELIFAETMAERKMKMLELSDVVIAFPGGIGTLDEITEAHCLASIGQIKSFVGILNAQNYFDPMLEMYENMKKFGYASKNSSDKIFIESNPKILADLIMQNVVK
ncbi:TIGR00730 family Rossman fold protein [Weeksellaceae bacterium A-14]